MAIYCEFHGSYYDPEPWTYQQCSADFAVPEGCPIHFVTSGPTDPAAITAERVAANGMATVTPSSSTILGTDNAVFSVMDVWSCDCHQTNIGVQFDHVEVNVPGTVAGESVRLWARGGSPYEIEILPAGPCATPEWPTQYTAALACDRCPVDPDHDQDGDGVPDEYDDDYEPGGCAVGGDPSVILVGLALLPFMRRRRAKILSSE
jgi:MYXO-CTERM domain-containing protein